MKDKLDYITGGIPLTFILFIIFLILKLTGTVAWSWWMVTLPLWIVPAAILGTFGFFLMIFAIFLLFMGIGYIGLWFYDNVF